jgi:hypothetical protein
MFKRSALRPVRVPIRLPDGRNIFGIRFKLRTPRESPSTPSAGPQAAGHEPSAGRADRTDAAYQLKVHREASAAAAAAAITVTEPEPEFQPGSLGPAVTKILEENPGLSVDAAIIRAILEEDPEAPR